MAKVITVPKTPKSAYDPNRKVSTLLKAHIANLEATTRRQRGVAVPMSRKKPRTEAQASAYIAALTESLHPQVLTAPAQELPPAVFAPERLLVVKKRRARTTRTNASARGTKRSRARKPKRAARAKR